MHFLDILEIFGLDMDRIRSNLLNMSAWKHDFLSTSVAFYNIFARVYVEIKIWGSFRLFVFLFISFAFPFSFFLIFFCCSDWPSTRLASPWKTSEQASLCHRVATCNGRKFCSEFSLFLALRQVNQGCLWFMYRKMELPYMYWFVHGNVKNNRIN